MYDVIGDIHGHAAELRLLLDRLGYAESNGIFRHPTRQALFLGDFIDRGLAIREVLTIVRNMVEAGAARAVMGNHEFNALCYATPDPAAPGEFLRPHNEHNVHQHRATMHQFAGDPAWSDWLNWFRTLPVFLELDGLRCIHACWHPHSLQEIGRALSAHGTMTAEFLEQATAKRTPLFDAIEIALKGIDVRLPEGVHYHDKDGHLRRRVRLQWYRSPHNQTWRSYTISVHPEEMPDTPFPAVDYPDLEPYAVDAPPVFFGHYWLSPGEVVSPTPRAPNAACLDYSVARGGQLVAYRWDGEQILSPDKFVAVPAHHRETPRTVDPVTS